MKASIPVHRRQTQYAGRALRGDGRRRGALECLPHKEALSVSLTTSGTQKSPSGSWPPSGVEDCLELLEITLDQLNTVLHRQKTATFHDSHTWLSAALTNQATCSESLEAVQALSDISAQVQVLAEHICNLLALHKKVADKIEEDVVAAAGGSAVGNRKLLSVDGGFPEWLSVGDRRLLEASSEEIQADAVVAQDGSGTHSTIGEAIAFVSLASNGGGTKKKKKAVKKKKKKKKKAVKKKSADVSLPGKSPVRNYFFKKKKRAEAGNLPPLS
ncbi:hypothetical protein Cni_G12313 [Canna indica]|uniref:Pectinesterase inhibitor domain-containing protein n=1 Tax=Canna indica TaxID=4628 RepID=A0AAQ3KAF2_9LILI|nr:hypothetical protein Cni_G12313 [Canna indica]